MPAHAQEDGDEIVVTGSRIKQKNLVSSSPITSVTNEDIASRGITRIEDLVNELPQALAAQGSNVGNGSSGTAQVDLRGLGATRTMVLIDGRRMGPGSPNTIAPDLNQIPAALVKNVEILTGGASAVYGSDGLAGVVNFFMDRDFEGARVDFQVGAYQHSNRNDTVQSVLQNSGNLTPSMTGHQLDGAVKDLTLMFGSNFDGGKGNITGYVGYRNAKEVVQGTRDYSGCAFGNGSTVNGGFTCVGSFTTPLGTFTDATFSQFFFTLDENNPNEFRNVNFANDTFNFNPTNHFQRPGNRYTGGIFAKYDLTAHDEIYTDFMFMDNRTIAQIAFSGNFGVTSTVSCDNPFMSANQRNALCTSRGFGPNDNADLILLRRNVEGDPRQDDLRHTNYRNVLGIRGDFRLLDDFEYDVSISRSTVHFANNYLNEVSAQRSQRALLVTTDPVTGQPVCDSVLDGTDPSCVPINWFQIGGVTDEALNYISGSGFQDGNLEQNIAIASLSGDLTDYGFKLPSARDGVKMVIGGEYREDDYELRTDQAFTTGDLAGQGGPSIGLAGSYDSWEAFGELQIPLMQEQPLAEDLTLDASYRYADNELSGGASSYAGRLKWQLNDLFMLRGSYQRAVRAANAIELFRATSIGLFNFAADDPCSGAVPVATLAQCQNSGVTPAQYGNITANPASQYNQLLGGNTALNPEKSDTFSFGGVIRGTGALDGASLTLDYYNIKIIDFISTVPPVQAVNRCVFDGDPFFCSLVNRSPVSGSLWVTPDGFVTATNVNTGSLENRGIDAELRYDGDLPGDWGGYNLKMAGTYLFTDLTESLPGDTPFECVGQHSGQCGRPRPEWRHTATAGWESTKDFDIDVTWRHFSAVQDLGSADYFDISAAYRGIDDVTLRVGVDNFLDAEPPLSSNAGAGFGNGNTYPVQYDALGRYLFARATIDF